MQQFLYRLLRNRFTAGLLFLFIAQACLASGQRILVLGDSISAAYGMSLNEGWVAKMEQQLNAQGYAVEVINASISGETTDGGLRRLPPLLAEHQPTLVLIELGGNDGLRGYPVKRLRTNLGELVKASAGIGASVILLPMEIPPNYGTRYTTDFRDSYTMIAEQYGATLTPFILDGIATDSSLMQADGIHPTADAQALLLENVLPTITRALDPL